MVLTTARTVSHWSLDIQYIQDILICVTVILSNQHLKYKINDRDHKPPHVHVEGGGASVRINLLTLEIMDKETDFSLPTLRRICEYVEQNQRLLLDEWEARHG
jgi:hypothetical protein